MDDMASLAEVAEKNIRKAEQLEILLILKESKDLEEAIKLVENKIKK